ncbi:MAG: glycosyltransferase [Prevotellaceae bacterium]|nr:glycosyltransferase [Prevotellaceae bacterium]
MLYSIIVPVYNRSEELAELLESLVSQEGGANFEVIIVDDGSTSPCAEVVTHYASQMNIYYHYKPNTGRSDTRNVGMQLAKGDYFLLFDSDCVLPPQYFTELEKNLQKNYADCFGGPDTANESFMPVQKAISYAMTSFFTTGGIRGGKSSMEKFKPRTFNMGFSRKVYEKVGGFRDMFGEDIDLSIRIANAGFCIALYHDVFVYHKRRVSFKKFYKQVRNFGSGRISLAMLHKGSLKLVHTLPAFLLLLFIAYCLLFIVHCSLFIVYCSLLLPAAYCLLLFSDALIKTSSPKVALLAVWASIIQIVGYGWGFITAFVQKIILRKGLETQEKLKKLYK